MFWSFALSFLLFIQLNGRLIAAQDVFDGHLVGFRCGWPSIHLTDGGWTADNATDCLSSPEDILNYCKKVYPNSDVRNFVESDQNVTVGVWCDFGGRDCASDIPVRPYLCLIGSFVANDLVVADGCVADRIIDSRLCKDFGDWKVVVTEACDRRGLRLERFSVLDPCDIGQFSGVQFGCCPVDAESIETINNYPAVIGKVGSNDPVPTVAKAVETTTSENEHRRYLRVKAELHKQHDEEISKIMDAWDEAQKEVGKMRRQDPEMAEKLERKMTARFQKTISSLEEKEEVERRRIDSDHERIVQQDLNVKKRKAMEAYMAVISRRPTAPMREVFQVLRHYVRVEEKDRMHVINHFLRLTETDPSAAESIRTIVAERLKTIRMRLKRAVDMLSRVAADYQSAIGRKIKDIIEEYEGFDDIEASIIHGDFGKNDSNADKKTDGKDDTKTDSDDSEDANENETKNVGARDRNVNENESVVGEENGLETPAEFKKSEEEKEIDFDKSEYETGEIVETKSASHPNHLGTNELRLMENKPFKSSRRASSSVGPLVLVVTTSVFLVTVTVLGIVVWRRYVETRRIRSRLRDDSRLLASSSSEEGAAHIAGMQANGYENPTYKYFETKASE